MSFKKRKVDIYQVKKRYIVGSNKINPRIYPAFSNLGPFGFRVFVNSDQKMLIDLKLDILDLHFKRNLVVTKAI